MINCCLSGSEYTKRTNDQLSIKSEVRVCRYGVRPVRAVRSGVMVGPDKSHVFADSTRRDCQSKLYLLPNYSPEEMLLAGCVAPESILTYLEKK